MMLHHNAMNQKTGHTFNVRPLLLLLLLPKEAAMARRLWW